LSATVRQSLESWLLEACSDRANFYCYNDVSSD